MMRPAIALAVLAAVPVMLACLPAGAAPERVAHEDPGMAAPSPDAASLLLFHADLFDLAMRGRYEEARLLLDDLRYATIPSRLRYVVERYGSLSGELMALLESIEARLGDASRLLERYRLREAETLLDGAAATFQDADVHMRDLLMTHDILSEQLGLDSLPGEHRIREAHGRLEGALGRLKGLIDQLRRLQDSLTARQQARARIGLTATRLTLEPSPTKAFVGERLRVRGNLTADSGGLGGREVTLLVGDVTASIATDERGGYDTEVVLPLSYRPRLDVSARYTPSGADLGVYAAAKSPSLTVNLDYYETVLQVSVPSQAHPGRPISIEGQVDSGGPAVERHLALWLDGRLIGQAQVQGRFSLQPVVPGTTLEGEHSLAVEVVASGRHKGTRAVRNIHVVRVPLVAEVQTPGILLLPATARVSGRVHDDAGPVAGAKVTVSLEDAGMEVLTAADGGFVAQLEVPVELSVVDPREIAVRIEPAEPHRAPMEVRRRLVTLNPAAAGLAVLGLAAVGLLVRRRRPVTAPGSRDEAPQEAAQLPGQKRPRRLADHGSTVIGAYLGALAAAESATGQRLGPVVTLREFLARATGALGAALEPFARLTALAEASLYGGPGDDADRNGRAAQLAARVKKELGRDAA